jgi:type 1 glutamine amidotransferase
MKNVVIVSGAGQYSDPWHPFDATSTELKRILSSQYATSVTTDVVHALTTLEASGADLVVLNLGSAGVPVVTDSACVAGIARYLEAGGALLVCHVTATAFPSEPVWEDIVGGRWVRGISMHPERGDAEISLRPVEHPILRGLADFVLVDERYSYLRVAEDAHVLAVHSHDGIDHSLIWTHVWHKARVVYNGLGHDAQSFDSSEHRAIVAAAAEWLLGAD